jgi:hypothetical protein
MDHRISLLESLFITVIEEFLKHGGKIQSRSFGAVRDGAACPLEVLLSHLAETQDRVLIQDGPVLLSKINLPSSEDELWAFVFGYDNCFREAGTEFHSLGLKIREKYPPCEF